jgi:hypothetical protein
VLHVLQDFIVMMLPNILQIVLLELTPLVLAQTDKVFQLVSLLVLFVQQVIPAWVDSRSLLVVPDTTAMQVMAFARFAQLATDAQTLLSNRFSVNLVNIINQAEPHAQLVSKDIFALIQH